MAQRLTAPPPSAHSSDLHSGATGCHRRAQKGNGKGRPPKAKRYIIRVDKTKFTVEVASMTGRAILTLAGKTPAWLSYPRRLLRILGITLLYRRSDSVGSL